MLNIWLNESKRITDEIIKESNLKEIVREKVDEFMKSEKFEDFILSAIGSSIHNAARDYAEYYITESRDFDVVIKEIIAKHYKGELKE